MGGYLNITDYQFGKSGKRSADEARELGRKGGIASGITRRRQRDARKVLTCMLNSKPMLTRQALSSLHALGIRGNGTNRDQYNIELIVMAALVQKAMRGNVEAFELILQIMGEDSRSQIAKERLEFQRSVIFGFNDSNTYETAIADDGFLEAMR